MRIPIAVKLVVVTFLLMLAATIPIAVKSSSFFEKISGNREDDVNGSQARVIAEEVQNTLQNLVDKIKIVGGILYKNVADENVRQSALELSFRSDHDLVSVEIISMKDGKPTVERRVVNDDYLKQYDLKREFIESLNDLKPFPVAINFGGDVEIRAATIKGGAPLLAIGVPLVRDTSGNISDVALAYIRLDRIQKVFATVNERTIFLIDREGHVLAHPNEQLVLTGKKLDDNPIVTSALKTRAKQQQQKFNDPQTGERYAGAFAKTLFGVTVISQVPESVILEPSRQVRRISFLLTGLALSLALFGVVWFSASLTHPLETLVKATDEIAKGNFNIRADIHTKDEVGELANAFNNMIDGLKERDKVKSLFGKFHGTGIANKLMSGEMKLGGDQREATVFFSDIRSFTSISEQVSAQEVVNMLNEYFKIMVGIIQKNKGVVDKFIGDAIMAVWGAPETFGNDAANAIMACIEMRQALAKLNSERLARGTVEIRIGMGVHTGQLIAGNIGSDDRMEYTVIGDTVNIASRIEAATKAYGTDILVSSTTQECVGNSFIFEKVGSAIVKGKSEPIQLFKVTGYIAEDGRTVLIETPYSSFAPEDSEKVHAA